MRSINRHSECDTQEYILVTGEQLCMHCGFTGMGLNEFLETAEVPEGSFYHYFRSKEAFGIVLFGHRYTGYLQRLVDRFDHDDGSYRDRLLAYYQHTLNQFYQQGVTSGCLTVKLSAKVCDLLEDVRTVMDHGAGQVIALLSGALGKGRQEDSLAFDGEAMTLSQVLYPLWLGINLQAKITRSVRPLESTLAHAKQITTAPAV